ncbi:MAG: hypothetical protein PHE53_07660 [Thermoguttaceae bacterium]|nr:hypothetical protein [Thermoguttaceae bacterium]
MGYPLAERATRITPITLIPSDEFSANLRWNSTGAATRIYQNGIWIASLTPSEGIASQTIPIQTGECTALDIFELPGEPHPQPGPFEQPSIHFDAVTGADGYRIYYGSTPNAWRRIDDIRATSAKLPIRLFGGWGKTYYFRAETIDGNQVSFPGTRDAFPTYLAVSLPDPPTLEITSIAGGIQIAGLLDTVADYPGFVPHAITAEVWSGNTLITNATLTTASPSAEIPLADGTYILRTRQQGGPWIEIFDRVERTIHIQNGQKVVAWPIIQTADARMTEGRLRVVWTATETDADYQYGIWLPPNTTFSSPDIRIRRGEGDYEIDIPVETSPESVILAPLTAESVGPTTTLTPTPYPSRPTWQHAE